MTKPNVTALPAKITKNVIMTYQRSTHNTHVYVCHPADEMNAVCKQVYLNKKGIPTEPPAAITLMVEYSSKTGITSP